MGPVRILIVDDNHLVRRLVALDLETAGYVPVEAESGEAALAIARTDPPDAWIVDDQMPGMCGADLVRLLRRSSRAPVIGVSGRVEGAVDLLDAGANAFLSKPVEAQLLLATLARLLARGAHWPEQAGLAP